MRYIGSKRDVLGFIQEVFEEENLDEQGFEEFCDIFAGTGAVAKHFKKQGFRIIANDIQHYAYTLNKAYIENTGYPSFDGIIDQIDSDVSDSFQISLEQDKSKLQPFLKVLNYLNSLDGVEGFIYSNYTPEGTEGDEYQRKYLSSENGKKIDAIRQKIEEWKEDDSITEEEYYLLLTSLIDAVTKVSNTSGTYGAFLKDWDPRAKKEMTLKPVKILESEKEHEVYQKDANELVEEIDPGILYLDPPYNGRQYSSNYHLLETVSLYDNPEIRGKTGLRKEKEKKSDYCYKTRAYEALEDLVEKASADVILMSYSNEGILSQEELEEILSSKGDLTIYGKGHRRYRSDSFENREFDREDDKVTELLFVVRT